MSEKRKHRFHPVVTIGLPLVVAILCVLMFQPRAQANSQVVVKAAQPELEVGTSTHKHSVIGPTQETPKDSKTSNSVTGGKAVYIDDGDEPYVPSPPVPPTMFNETDAPAPELEAMVVDDSETFESNDEKVAAAQSESESEVEVN